VNSQAASPPESGPVTPMTGRRREAAEDGGWRMEDGDEAWVEGDDADADAEVAATMA
jgi:hypothetical protein